MKIDSNLLEINGLESYEKSAQAQLVLQEENEKVLDLEM